MENIVIIGGGIAGLSCLNALLDKGELPLLLEGATIGTPKMCGEFLAPAAVTALTQWRIGPIQPIYQSQFFAGTKQLTLSFPKSAGAMSRSDVEIQLAERATKLGGRIRENMRIQSILPATNSSVHRLHMESGEIINAKTLFIATGKYGQTIIPASNPGYLGIKLHFKHVVKPGTLQMYSLKDAYLGIVPISSETSNCACLMKREAAEKTNSLEDFFHQLIGSQPALKTIFKSIELNKTEFLEGQAPVFQLKKTPDWPNSFWIGDAFATLHPAIGSGFAHGIESAILAAHFYHQHTKNQYKKHYTASIKPKLILGNLFNTALIHPKWSQLALPVLEKNTWLTNIFLKKLGYL